MSTFAAFIACAATPKIKRFSLTGIFVNPQECGIAATDGSILLALGDKGEFCSTLPDIAKSAKAAWRIDVPLDADQPFIIRVPKTAAAVDRDCIDFDCLDYPDVRKCFPAYSTVEDRPYFSFSTQKKIGRVYRELGIPVDTFFGFCSGKKTEPVTKTLGKFTLVVMPSRTPYEEEEK